MTDDIFDFDKFKLAETTETPDGRRIHRNATDTLTELLKHPMEEPFVFCVDEGIGDKYVQRLRVIQSKLRAEVKRLNRKPKVYKVMVDEIVDHEGFTEITIRKTLNQTHQMAQELRAILSDLSEEEDIK